MSLYKKFDSFFRRSYKKNPDSFFCRLVIRISRFIQPYKIFIQMRLAPDRYRQAFRKVLKTPAFPSNPDAGCEIHTITSHCHIFMYLTAIKSFLRFYQDIAVVAHDDGTLTFDDKVLLAKHVKGIRIIERKVADEKIGQLLRQYPYSCRARNKKVNFLQLFDFFHFSRADKIVGMDSDILFLSEPSEIIEWICAPNNRLMVLYEDAPLHQKQFLTQLDCNFPAHVCIAFFCLYKNIFNLELIENIIRQTETFWHDLENSRVQNIFPFLYEKKASEYGAVFFDKDKYQAFYYPVEDGVVFRHYVSSTFLTRFERHIADMQRVIREIQTGFTTDAEYNICR